MVFPTNGLTIKVLFKLVAIGAPLLRAPMATRPAEGMVASLLRLTGLDWPVPDVGRDTQNPTRLTRRDNHTPETT